MGNKPGLAMAWLVGATTPEEKESLEAGIRHSTLALGKLEEIIVSKLSDITSRECKTESYDKPSWAYYQADMNGQKKAYRELIDLLSFLHKP